MFTFSRLQDLDDGMIKITKNFQGQVDLLNLGFLANFIKPKQNLYMYLSRWKLI